jgi:hypothetical protein
VGREPESVPAPSPGTDTDREPIDEAELEARMAELREQLAHTPVEGIVAQVAYQLFEVGALHLSLQPPQLAQATVAIDAMSALVETLGDKLGEHEGPLREGLSQIRMAFVQIQKASATPPPSAPADQEQPQS